MAVVARRNHRLAIRFAAACLVCWAALNGYSGERDAFLDRAENKGSLSLVFLGDIMLGRGVAYSRMERGIQDAWAGVFDSIQPELSDADLVLGNLEAPLVAGKCMSSHDEKSGTGPYLLYAPVEAVRALTMAGIDILTLANNHIMDCGEQGLMETRGALQAAGFRMAGPDLAPLELYVKGWRITILAANTLEDGFSVQALEKSIQKAQKNKALVVVSLHWGSEYQSGPNRMQEEIAKRLARAGADILWGHHPHALQRIECLDGADGEARTLAMYSLGNAIFDQHTPPFVNRSAAVTIAIKPQGEISVVVLPFVIDPRLGVVRPAEMAVAKRVREWLRTPISCNQMLLGR